MAESFVCPQCGRELPVSLRDEFDGRVMCESCLDSLTVVCDNCEALLWREDNCGNRRITLCEHCRNDHYSTCSQCGRLCHNDELHYLDEEGDDGYCDNCYESLDPEHGVQSYYYKPDPIFYGEGNRFMGVELEIDEGGELNRNAARLMAIANQDCDRLYVKHDGSLDDGMELVSHPMTLDYHMKNMPWPDIFREAVQMGYYSHQSRTCGLHVHVNRTAFGETQTEQEDVIARILFFVENHWNELLRFSRRTQRQMEQWAARYGRKDDPKAVLDHAKNNQFERYTCVNLTNYHTIEFRMFRGTLKLNSFIATLQMVSRICEVALFMSDQEIQNLTWTDFAAGCTEPELVQYLKERRLYINEPVPTAEEV